MLQYKMIDHTADLGMEFYGRSIEDLFISAATGLSNAITDDADVEAAESFDIYVEGMDMEDLLINWLRELLYFHHIRHMIFKEFSIKEFNNFTIRARITGERIDEKKHVIKREIKAATYHDLFVRKKKGLWTARVIFDI